MIADVVNLTVTGIAFCHVAGRLIVHRGVTAGIVMTQKWVRRLDRSAARNISDLLTGDF